MAAVRRASGASIPIWMVSSDYDPRAIRHLRQVSLLLVPVAACIAVYRFLVGHPDWADFLLQFPICIGATFALAAAKLYPRFEWFLFKNHFGRPLFTILREPNQRVSAKRSFTHYSTASRAMARHRQPLRRLKPNLALPPSRGLSPNGNGR